MDGVSAQRVPQGPIFTPSSAFWKISKGREPSKVNQMSEMSVEEEGLSRHLGEGEGKGKGDGGLATALRQKSWEEWKERERGEIGKERPLQFSILRVVLPPFLPPNMSLDFHDNLPKPK